MRGVIRIGDSTSHGGRVETGREGSTVMGRAVACVGDRCTCPMNGHEHCVIVEGDEDVRIDGRAVAFDGHRTSCGATLVSSIPTSGRV
ncbi:PAAR domain-containing protein [Burkholderia pseudomallei]|uniref:PAAR domain-containing protein n=2 Tax=Burkholderia pseudomallei TaxID=28450 RepID=UPI00051061D6|nr:PAAR domain-containing protein [Burkholderia pseudomallei]KGX77703.1 PAAR motif family protein [Burkholderia pseudomallei MSHR435]AJX18446.1 PAAR motif family protein [Burkholderia pseudomallei MSHR491]KGD04978.1 PAAR motif family protein [Burkholderia pseudomallei]KGD45880.1 PAAR motif family protein [Burkholderia pseudomallei]KGW95434.1 PAAR motif family protein [Burkholderia pseudomallei MSHR449]